MPISIQLAAMSVWELPSEIVQIETVALSSFPRPHQH